MKTIAVLITCYNRVDTTIKCLKNLFAATVPKDYKLDIFLVDDNSPDKTGEIVKIKYPSINVIKGTGSLFWNRGMHLAWNEAAKRKDYDFYLWLNDDTYIEKFSIEYILEDYWILLEQGKVSIINGCLQDPISKKRTYVGRYKGNIIEPNGRPQICDSMPGNVVLIPKEIYDNVGNLDSNFTHGLGDTDYGLRTIKAGYYIHISSKYVGYCEANPKVMWHDPTLTFNERRKLLFSKTNGNIEEYLYYIKNHKGYIGMFLSANKTILRLLYPKLFLR